MRRRDFLATLTAAAGVAAWRPRGTARLRFGYAAITWNGNDRQAIDDIAAVGFQGIQLRQSAFDTWGDRPAELKDLLAQNGLVFVALSSGNVPLDPAAEKDTLALHARHAQFVRAAGGQFLQVTTSAPVPGRPSRTTSSAGAPAHGDRRRSTDLGIASAITTTWARSANRPTKWHACSMRLIRAMCACADIAHYQEAGGDPAAAIYGDTPAGYCFCTSKTSRRPLCRAGPW
jgi:inosose dehydratase